MSNKVCLCPFEEEEQMAFVQWCRANNITVQHSANELGGSTRAIKARAIKAKKMGTTAGFWDLEIFIPVVGVTGEIDAYEHAMIEMKRQKGATVSAAQKKWGEIYEKAGIRCRVCKGCNEAIAFVEEIIKEVKG